MAHALLINLGFVVGMMLALWLVAVRIKDVSFIDAIWGLGMAAIAAVSWLQVADPGKRAGLIAVMTAIWGGRLGVHLFTRWREHGEDRRYAKLLGKAKEQGNFAAASLKVVFAPQTVLLFVTCLPAQIGVLASPGPTRLGLLAWVGAALWWLGMEFEMRGDSQLKAFRADPANKDKVLDTGLWRYTRHPNYFGDTCVWWGIWLASLDTGRWEAWASVIGPLFVTFTLTRWSGKPLLEKSMAKRRPGYADYVERTSGFIPLPPRR